MATSTSKPPSTDSHTNGAAPAAAPEPTAPSPSATPTWQTPGHVAFDFRSDTVTTPTARMLAAIGACTLGDDVFREDAATSSLEALMAELTGQEAALVVLSGTMANQVAMRTHLHAPPHAVLCDARAHVLNYEAGGAASLSGALLQGVEARENGRYLTLEEIERRAVVDDDEHGCPTRVVSLENTLGGCVLPVAECRRVAAWARERGIRLHLDGARLWQAVAAGAGSLKDYAECFDSVSLCFSKGLGAPMGSVVVGSRAFVKRARWVRKMLGGGMRQSGILSAAARVAVEDVFLGGKLTAGHEVAERVAGYWEKLGGRLTLPTETNMVWVDLEHAGIKTPEYVKMAEEEGVKVLFNRLVVHHQICEDALVRLLRVFDRIWKEKRGTNGVKRKAEDEPVQKHPKHGRPSEGE